MKGRKTESLLRSSFLLERRRKVERLHFDGQKGGKVHRNCFVVTGLRLELGPFYKILAKEEGGEKVMFVWGGGKDSPSRCLNLV